MNRASSSTLPWRWRLAAMALGAASLLAGCDGGAGAAEHDAGAAPDAAPKELAAPATRAWARVVEPGDASLLELPARVHAGPGSLVHVDLPFDARIEEVAREVGDRVAAGDPLFVVSSPGLAEAAASLSGTQALIGTQQRRRDELDALRSEGIVDRSSVFALESSLGQLESERRATDAMLHSLGLSQAELRGLRKTGRVAIRALAPGVLTELHAHPGEVVAAGRSVAVVRGQGRARIEVLHFGALPSELRLEFVGLDGAPIPLAPNPVASSVEPGLGRTVAWYEPADGRPMADGGVGRVRVIDAGEVTHQIPRGALRMHEGHAVVLRRAEGGELEPVSVEVLRSSGASALVRGEGLSRGDEIAADAASVLGWGAAAGGGHVH